MNPRWLLLVLALVGCGSESAPGSADASQTCRLDGVEYPNGFNGTCTDGCNRCTCRDGIGSTTAMACGCFDARGEHARGSTWTCPDGCNTCKCNVDFTISQTFLECDAGADAAADAADVDAPG